MLSKQKNMQDNSKYKNKRDIQTLATQKHSNIAQYSVIDCSGGVSSGVYATCNVGLLSGDSQANIVINRKKIQKSLALKQLVFAQQVHKSHLAIITSEKDIPKNIGQNLLTEQGCDAMITNLPDTGLAIQHADCQAVMLFDPKYSIIAAIHCGWRGSVQNIIAKTINAMKENFNTEAQSLLAFISPSLGVCCAEFINYKKEFPPEFYRYKKNGNHFDFKVITQDQLKACGVEKENIVTNSTCTCCSPIFFSYRRSQKESCGITGRNCTVIFMPKK